MRCARLSFIATAMLVTALLPVNQHNRKTGFDPQLSKSDVLQMVPVAPIYEYGKHDFGEIAILNNGEMWAVGYDGNDPRRMYRSRDNGYTWQIVPITSSGFTLNAITFPDDEHGFAVGGYGTIMITKDSGQSWIQGRRPTQAILNCVSFANESVGYVAGSTGLYDRATDSRTFGVDVLRTSDGGRTWRLSYRDRTSIDAWEVVALSETTALLLLDSSRLLRTTDGGRTWDEVFFKLRGPTNIAFTKDGVGWMVGEKLFLRSTDGGVVWKTSEDLPCSLLRHDWWEIKFANNIGIAVSEDGAIAISYDSGESWREIKSNLQEEDTIWFNKSIGFKENLRGVSLRNRRGVILGSQRLFVIENLGAHH